MDVIGLHNKGLSQREISRKLGISRPTVWKYLKDPGRIGQYRRKRPRPSVKEGESVHKITVHDKRNIQEILNKRKNGQIFPCLLASSVLLDSQGVKVGQMGISRDITEVKKAEAEREQLIADLREALENVKTLKGLLPICAQCKKIRDDDGFWQQVESYIEDHLDTEFSHGMCPACLKETYPEIYKDRHLDLSNQ